MFYFYCPNSKISIAVYWNFSLLGTKDSEAECDKTNSPYFGVISIFLSNVNEMKWTVKFEVTMAYKC